MSEDRSTRVAILDAAERLFAGQGFPATTIKQIATGAGVNSALLYYYFQSKERLYSETLRRLFGELVSEGLQRLEPGLSPAEGVRRLVELQIDFMAAHPQAPRLLVRELVDHEAKHAVEQITQLAATIFSRLCDFIRRGQEEGYFRKELDPRFAAISTVAQVAYLFIARPAVGILLGHGTQGPPAEVVRAFGRHAADFALAALAVSPAARPAASSGKAE